MPFSHHSHSGQFCGHAKNTLEEMVQTAIDRKMQVFALTEHMPRDAEDLYPEEVEANHTAESLLRLFDAFHAEAVRLRQVYASGIEILIGFESDWVRPSSLKQVENILAKYQTDFFVGSVHHVHAIPIDFDKPMYEQARQISGGTDEGLFEDYFDAQLAMLQALQPPVVGHFDLIRLLSDDPERSFKQWDKVWQKIRRNLNYITGYGGLLELNSSALRKGMSEPYPKVEICEVHLALGGRFTLSDDSHGVEQVGLNYHRVLETIKRAGITEIHYLTRTGQGGDARFPSTTMTDQGVTVLEQFPFWAAQRQSAGT